MEKEVEARELACRALLAKTWIGSPDAAVSLMTGIEGRYSLYELEGEPEIYGWWQGQQLIKGARITGSLVGENSYVMEISDLVEYYWESSSQQGFICLVSEDEKFEVHHGYPVAPAGQGLEVPSGTHAEQVLVVSSASPFRPFLPNELKEFCIRYNILDYIPVATELVRKCFPDVREIHLQTENDPEGGDEWLVVSFSVAGEIAEVLDRYDRYTDIWISSVPWPERDKIRLSYNLV